MFHKTRTCRLCSKEIFYAKRNSYYAARTANSACKECSYKEKSKRYKGSGGPFFGRHHTPESKELLRQSKLNATYLHTPEFSDAVKKGMNGKKGGGDNYPFWVMRYGVEEANRRLAEASKKRARPGKLNGMWGKPSPHGSGQGWKGWYKSRFFRSLRELAFMVEMESTGHTCESAEACSFAIPYVDWAGKEGTYYPDFLVDKKRLYEIKPKRLWNTPLCLAKKKAAIAFCESKGWEYLLYDPVLDFEAIREIWKRGDIRWMKGYEEKFASFITSKANGRGA